MPPCLLIIWLFCVVAGTWLGTRVLDRLDDERFTQLYKWTLTAVAIRLVWSGLA